MKISLTISKRKGLILNFFLRTTVFVTLRGKNFFLFHGTGNKIYILL